LPIWHCRGAARCARGGFSAPRLWTRRARQRGRAEPPADPRRRNDLVPVLAESVVVDVELRRALDAHDDGGVVAPTPGDENVVAHLVSAPATHEEQKRNPCPRQRAHHHLPWSARSCHKSI